VRRLLVILATLAVAVLVVVGLTQAGGKDGGGDSGASARPFDLAAARAKLASAPRPLGDLYAQANALLPGGRRAFAARLGELRGHPVVISKWASWCGPCRMEFPFFQQVAAERGARIAFVGVDGKDQAPAARAFLQELPLPFPSYEDPDEAIARSIEAPQNFPITVFLDDRGRTAFIHQGAYRSAADLRADIDRYLPGAGA
jgi:thiol-disulfide isomerase/thioredoxin